ncbi:MAG: elongation factor G-like protein EF-G2 [Actinomycetota bacterium]|nr:elongation factor G-like protein EF-G2 [Actinomycetota bacterium]
MSDKSSAGGPRGRSATVGASGSPGVSTPERIRNVALVGHSGAGKTTLVEALLLAAGAITRRGRVEDGTTASDIDEAEIRQHRSVSLSLLPLEHDGVKVNLLDTPGYPDFVGELRAGLRAADAALFVVSAVDGVDGVTSMLWDECAAVGMPRAVVVTRLDSPRADFEETVAVCARVFGEALLPLSVPLHADDESVAGLLGLLDRRVYDYSSGTRQVREADAEHLPLIAEARDALIEGIIAESEDETLMDRYLAGEELDVPTLMGDLETAVARGHFYPVVGVAALSGVGICELLDVLTRALPSPAEHGLPAVTRPDGTPCEPLTCDPAGRLVAEVVKTTTDPFVGRLSLVRVFSGTLRPDTVLHVSGHGRADHGHPDHDVDERVAALSSPLGRSSRRMAECVAGDMCAVAKLAHAETGDTLSARDAPLLIEPWTMPEPLLPVALVPASKADEDRLGAGLARLVAEDPTVRLENNVDTGQLLLWCMGEAHVDVLLERLAGKYGTRVGQVPVRVAFRETFAAPAQGLGRHVKQSGGHGQYAVCNVVVEPLAPGEGFEFVDKVVGGAVPRQFIPSVEKGVRAQMATGLGAGFPVVDLRVTLCDGKAHSVDSSDMAFQLAGALALKDAAARAQLSLLEPVLAVSVDVPDALVGAVMGDLSTRRARVTGTEPWGSGRTLVRAQVPEVEMLRYAIDLRSLTSGTGSFSRAYAGHEPMPSQLAARQLARASV